MKSKAMLCLVAEKVAKNTKLWPLPLTLIYLIGKISPKARDSEVIIKS